MNRIVLSSDLNHDYLFFVATSCLVWYHFGFKPLLLAIGDPEEWKEHKRGNLMLWQCRERAMAEVVFVPEIEGMRRSTVAQMSRIYASAFVDNPDDFLLTSDIDMWPLDKDWYQPRDPDKIHLHGANLMKHVNQYPISYIGMKVKHWRSVMNLRQEMTAPEAAVQLLKSDYQSVMGASDDGMKAWCCDEKLFSTRLHQFAQPDLHLRIDRVGSRHGFVGGRVDRGNWVPPAPREKLVDAHLLRPGYDAHWENLKKLLSTILAPEDVGWADRIRDMFKEMA